MTNEKFLSLINKAIDNLEVEEKERYGFTPVKYMRDNGIKSTDKMPLFTDSVGAYLEEMRCAILAQIEAEAAKTSGKGSILSNVKKLFKNATELRNTRPFMSFAHYDKEENKYWFSDGCFLLVANSSEGMDLAPEKYLDNSNGTFDYKKYVPTDMENYHAFELPPVQKIATYRKNAKTKEKQNRLWDMLVFSEFGIKGKYLEPAMRITGATEIWVKDHRHTLVMKGNGYTIVICPMKITDDEGNFGTPTDFDVF